MNPTERLSLSFEMIKSAAKWDKLLRAGELRFKDFQRLPSLIPPSARDELGYDTTRKLLHDTTEQLQRYGHDTLGLRELREALNDTEGVASKAYYDAKARINFGPTHVLKSQLRLDQLPHRRRLLKSPTTLP